LPRRSLLEAGGQYLPLLVIAILLLFYFRNVTTYSANIPYQDDYDAILRSLMAFQDRPSLSERIAVVFAQHNEHRMAVVRAVAFLSYRANGFIDFRLLILLGNLSLVGLLFLLWRAHRRGARGFRFFLPVAFILFAPQYWETMTWATGSLSNLYVLFFAVLSLCALCWKDGWGWFLLAAVSAILSLYSQGGGILVFVLGAGILAFRRRHKELAAWLIVAGASLAFYFHGYAKPIAHPSIVEAIVGSPLRTLQYFFSLVGSALYVYSLAGVLMVAFFVYLTWKKYHETNLAVYTCLLFLLMDAMLAAITRAGLGVDLASSSRYRIVSILTLAFLYLAAVEAIPACRSRNVLASVVVLALIYHVATEVQFIGVLSRRQADLRAGLAQWNESGEGLAYPDALVAARTMQESVSRRIYAPEQ